MSALHSPLWHRVEDLRPHLRAQVSVQRQLHRGEVWHQLADASTGRRHRLNEQAWQFVGSLDGETSVGVAWTRLLAQCADGALTQNEAIAVLEQLSGAELLAADLPPDIGAQFRQKQQRDRRSRWMALNPFSIRLRLFDPTPLLRRADSLLPWLFSRSALLLWVLLILPALPLAASSWNELRAFAASHVESPRFLLIAWCLYPVIKALHEAGHALAVRRWGGAVHDVGMTLFVLVPVPYVDASAASGFPHRSQRAVVSAIGIMIELLIAALALFAWNALQPGLLRDVAFVSMLIAGLSTIVFNGNPLLRFDGYFLLCDLFDLPNLDQRSRSWWRAALQRRLLGSTTELVMLAPGERKWMVLYAPLAWSFRLALAIQTMFWGAAKSVLLGAVMALLFVGLMLLAPLRVVLGMLGSPAAGADTARQRRARRMLAAALVLVLLALCVVPMPFGTTAQAVVWLPEHAQVRAGSAGFLQTLNVADGQQVTAGQALAQLEDPALVASYAQAQSRLEALRSEQYQVLRASRTQAASLEQAIAHGEDEAARMAERIALLTVRSAVAGRVVLVRQEDLPGSYLRQGALLGYVVEPGMASVRAVVPHADAALVRERTKAMSVRLDDQPEAVFAARLEHDVPAASQTLPSAALADRNGGVMMTDPMDTDHLKTLEPFFMFDATLPALPLSRIGGRGWAYFDFGREPLAQQWLQMLRLVLVQRFGGAS
ncbi:MAG: efflux RND transporter periplasmic adaptor subunit [Janthinobacterium lividum]